MLCRDALLTPTSSHIIEQIFSVHLENMLYRGSSPISDHPIFRMTSAACPVKGNFPFIYQVQCRGSSLLLLLTSQGLRRVTCRPPKEPLAWGVGEHRFTAPLVVLTTFAKVDRR